MSNTLAHGYRAHKLATSDRPRLLFEYRVSGVAAFPADMLRYDSCWPASGEDVSKLCLNYLDAPLRRERRVVNLRSYRAPTEERWRSFGWEVVA